MNFTTAFPVSWTVEALPGGADLEVMPEAVPVASVGGGDMVVLVADSSVVGWGVGPGLAGLCAADGVDEGAIWVSDAQPTTPMARPITATTAIQNRGLALAQPFR